MYTFKPLVIVLVLSLLLSACGGGSSSGRSGAVVNPPTTPPPTDPAPTDPPDDDPVSSTIAVLPPETEFEPACSNSESSEDQGTPTMEQGDTSGASSGVLVDSAVSGVRYETASLQGTTDHQGHFYYRDGESIRFHLGNAFLGEVEGMAQVSPFDLVGSAIPVGMNAITAALGDKDDPFHRVIDTAVLLQSMDDDGQPGNGVTITPEVASLVQGQNDYQLIQALTEANAQGLFSAPHGVIKPVRALAHLYSALGIEAHTYGLGLEQADWDGDGIPNDVTRYQYNADGNLVRRESTHETGQFIESWTYDESGRLLSSNEQEFGEIYSETRRYSINGELLLQESDHDDNGIPDRTQRWTYRYNPDGSLQQVTMVSREDPEDEPSSAVATFEYNSAGRPTRVEIRGEGLREAAEQLGLPTVTYLEYGTDYIISYTYDAEGDLTADTLDASNPELGYRIVNRRFDNQGNVTHYHDRFLQYGTGNEEQVTTAEYRYEYDTLGNMTRRWEDENGDGRADRIHHFEYDDQGRVSREENDWDGNGKTDDIAYHGYDQHGALIRTEWDNDADGRIDFIERWPYQYEYDQDGRITRRTVDLNSDGTPEEVIGYAYHSDGTLQQEDVWSRDVFVGGFATWQYNALGQLLREERGFGNEGLVQSVISYSYDACGGPRRRETYDEVGFQTSAEGWHYDNSGLLRRHEWEGDGFATFTEDSLLSHLPLIILSDGFERWQYDKAGRIIRYHFECYEGCVAFSGWDGAVEIPSQTINREYDQAGRVIRELVDDSSDGWADSFTRYEYDNAGRLVNVMLDTDADGTANQVTNYQYDDSGRLVRRESDENGDGRIDSVEITQYDSQGNIVAVHIDDNNDGTPDESEEVVFHHDDRGNLVRQEVDRDRDGVIDEIHEWSYNANNALISHRYDEDANGVLDQVRSYEYDAEGNLLRETQGYSFDGDGVMEESETWEYVATGWGHLFNNPE